MIAYELPPHIFDYINNWENYYLDFTWDEFDNNWNT